MKNEKSVVRGGREERRVPVFDEDEPVTLSVAVVSGLLMGSAYAVFMTVLGIALSFVFEGGPVTDGRVMGLTFIAAGLAGGLLQALWFSIGLHGSLSYPMRILGFGLTYFGVLAACAAAGGWLPQGVPGAWASFSISYLAILAVCTVVIGARLRRTRASYDELLKRYRASLGEQ